MLFRNALHIHFQMTEKKHKYKSLFCKQYFWIVYNVVLLSNVFNKRQQTAAFLPDR